MNHRHGEQLETSYRKLNPKGLGYIDIRQLSRAFEWNRLKEKNPVTDTLLKNYCQDSQVKMRKYPWQFDQLIQLVNKGLNDQNDNMLLDATFDMIDKDGDGFVGIQDLQALGQEIGSFQEDKTILTMLQKISDQGTKLDKQQFMSIYKKGYQKQGI